jgi:putative ABC transport system permease protein
MKNSRIAFALYRLLLRLYPAQFRDDYETEVMLVFRREWSNQPSRPAALWYFITVATSVLIDAPREHFAMLGSDLRYAVRRSLRNPLFTVVAIATLALGMGVNSALFSVVKPVLLEKLPYGHPDQLVRIWIHNPKQGYDHDISNWPRLEDWRRASCFKSVAGFTQARLILTGGSEPLQLRGASVTSNFFSMLEVRPFLGSDFEQGDDEEGRPRKIILSHHLWLSRFGADQEIIGRKIQLNSLSYEVVGIAPPQLRFPERDLDFWTPLAMDNRTRQNRGNFWMDVAGRLRDGVSLQRAQSEMDAYSRGLAEQHPEDRTIDGVILVSLQKDLTERIRPGLRILTGAVAFILLICCANIAGMLSARIADRGHELSIRAALGAGCSRMVRQLMTEALLLFVVGGAVGIAIAFAGVFFLVHQAPPDLPQLRDTKLDLTVAAFTLVLSAAAGVVFGALPAMQASRFDVARSLRQGARGLAGRLDSRRFRTVLTICQMGLAMILLTGSWLLIRSFERMQQIPPGYDSQDVSIAELQLPQAKYSGPQAIEFYSRLIERLDHIPGIQSAAGISNFFLGRLPDSATFSVAGRADKITRPLTIDVVTPEFFSTMKIPLLRGRLFDATDRNGALPAMLINDTTAKHYWPNADPLGHRITFDNPVTKESVWYTVVGVVGDTTRAGADQPVFTESYVPLAQNGSRRMQILLRGSNTRSALESAVKALDSNQPIVHFTSLEAAVGEQTSLRRFTTFLLAIFAAAALVITGVGLFGVISYLVIQRQQEFGIRFALGAGQANVLWLVTTRIMVMALVGVALGTLGSFALSGLFNSMLFGVKRFDAASYLAATGALLLICFIAAVSPALRAARTDPMIAMRAE